MTVSFGQKKNPHFCEVLSHLSTSKILEAVRTVPSANFLLLVFTGIGEVLCFKM